MPPRKRTKVTAEEEVAVESPSSPSEAVDRSPLKPYDITKTHRYIEPGPVVLVSTRGKAATRPNLMAMGFHMCVQHEDPPLIGARIGPWNYSFHALKETSECVIAVPGVDLAEKVIDIGNCNGDKVDKWSQFGFTALQGEEVRAPLVKECLANFECKVKDRRMVGKYALWVLEVVCAWVNEDREEKKTFHHEGDGSLIVDGERLNLREHMTTWKPDGD
ncbi:hypothetical protein EWM64_g1661 [Hericium alpestre]|uniref:Flavin reductase like domain-containing protein n=1 Tax=Hericium alpestre TaxID=135208 RepID=A0A4Z0A785_9AGAM|nr:hypothetical protein EWM64_g1661 [Hericium alpestre]